MISETFQSAGSAFAELVGRIPDQRWDAPGLGEWSVRDLVGHTSHALVTVTSHLAQPGTSWSSSTALASIQTELLDERSGLPARFWVAVLPAGGTPPQTVHEVRSYDASGRELCRLDPDTLTSRCTG
jgi:hypothetical protein